MIGQEKLLCNVRKMASTGFPRFTIICGAPKSGKTLVSKYIVNTIGTQYVSCGIKVEEVRDTINLAYKQSEPTAYVITGADKMSVAAKNALLKVTEEPPRKAYFIITITDLNNTLETLKSRACVLKMDAYSPAEIEDYITLHNYGTTEEERTIMKNVCTTPGMVDTMLEYDVTKFYNFINTVVDNIGTVSGVNAFKITQKLKYKDDGDGWDLTLFMRTLMLIYSQRMKEDRSTVWYQSCLIVSKYLSQLSVTGINKSSTVDMMILELRGAWQWNYEN